MADFGVPGVGETDGGEMCITVTGLSVWRRCDGIASSEDIGRVMLSQSGCLKTVLTIIGGRQLAKPVAGIFDHWT